MKGAVARAFGLFAAALGLVALAGWIFDIPRLASVRPEWIPMAPSTALLFALLGAAVSFGVAGPSRYARIRAAQALGWASAALALALFVLSFLGIRLELEHIGLALSGVDSQAPIGYMSPVTAACLAGDGVALAFALSVRDRPVLAMTGFWLGSLLLCSSAVFLLAYLFGTPLFYSGAFIPPALTTSLGIAGLSAAAMILAGGKAWSSGRQVDAVALRGSRGFIAVFALLAVGLIAVGHLQYRHYVEEHRAEVERELSAVAELKVRDVATWRRERLADAVSFAMGDAFANLARRLAEVPGDAAIRGSVRAWLDRIREAEGYDRAMLLDAKGAVLVSGPARPITEIEREHALRAMRDGRAVLGDFHRDRPDEPVRLSVLAPVAAAGRALGVVILDTGLSTSLDAIIGGWPTASRTAETLLVRREGDGVVYLNELRFRKGAALSLRFPLSRTEIPAVKAVLGAKGIVEGHDYRGEPVIAAVRAIGDPPWFLIAQVGREEFLESMQHSLWLTALFVGALLFAAGSSVALMWRHQRAGDYRRQLQTSQELAASLAQYRALTESAADAIVTGNQEGRIVGWNRAAERMFGYSGTEALGQPFARLMPQRYRAAHAAGFDSLQADPGRSPRTGPLELYGLTKGGSEFSLELSLSTWESPEGRFFTGILRDISDRKRAEQELARRNDLYDMLSQTNQAIVRLTSREELFPAVCRIAVEHGHFRFAWIGMLQADGTVKPVAHHGDDAGYIDSLRISTRESEPGGRGIAARALRTGEHVLSNDFLKDTATAPRHDQARESGVRAVGVFPIRERGRVAGVMVFAAAAAGFFTEDLLPTLDEMALDVSFALDYFDDRGQLTKLVQSLRESEARYHALFEDSNMAMLLIDPEDGRIIDANGAACAFYGWDAPALRASSIFDVSTIDRARVQLELQRTRDVKKELRTRHRLVNGEVRDVEVFTGPVDVAGRRLLLASVHDVTERLRIQRDLAESEGQFRGLVEQTFAGIYILEDGRFAYANPRLADILGYHSAGELIGRELLSFVAETDRATVAANLSTCLGDETDSTNYGFTALRKDGSPIDIGAQGARAMRAGRPVIIGLMQDISEKKHAEDQAKRYLEQLQTAFMQTVAVATTLVEMRDPYTAGHERRVAKLAVAIATELSLGERRIEGLRVAGYLHDIGKIIVPAEILTKPGRLSTVELELIQGHAQAGFDVLKDVDFPWPVAQMVLQHHERMDGRGYPQGLKGEDIVLEARILAVADVVEAMASHRPYRPSLGIDAALAEIERGRGTAYDPTVVDACLRVFREKGWALEGTP